MKMKVYDCVEMKRHGAGRIIKELKNLNAEKQLSYWQKAREEILSRKTKKN